MRKYGRYSPPRNYKAWEDDCRTWRDTVLTGEFSHWCAEFDGLPVDETCDGEWDVCRCVDEDRPDRQEAQHA